MHGPPPTAAVDVFVCVEQDNGDRNCERDEGHAGRLPANASRVPISGSVRTHTGPAKARMNTGGSPRIETGVTAVANILPFLPHTSPHMTAHASEEDGAVGRAAAGDAEAFRHLFQRHRSDVARLVYRMLGAAPDLDDVVQEVFVQVFRSLKDFRGQSKFSTWLHRVTVNVVLMHRRSARSRPILTEEASSDVVADLGQSLPDEDAERRERMRAFERLLSRLADKKRIVFVLHELEGMSPAEIGEVVGAPVLTVRTRLFYARREIESMLQDEPSLANLRETLGGSGSTSRTSGTMKGSEP